ncbi:nuclear transport factor 2 family protein [Streptomyces sp. Lzd4kr]|nr:nuclear transport factor 2 family protein [Streptomyces sp. Lzd4kr]
MNPLSTAFVVGHEASCGSCLDRSASPRARREKREWIDEFPWHASEPVSSAVSDKSAEPMSYRAIENLIATYSFLVDDADFAGLGELLDGATFTVGATTVIGKAAVEQLANDTFLLYEGSPRTRHVTTNLYIDVDERASTAVSRSYVTVFQQTPGFPLQPVMTGRYRDRFERRQGVWQFAERVVGEELTGDLSHAVRT